MFGLGVLELIIVLAVLAILGLGILGLVIVGVVIANKNSQRDEKQ